tara:strand:+ start:26 stop:226 length:201 start_codon:yes stop_codon:yes gene_type:complete
MQVKVRGTNIEGALRLFRRKVNESGVLFEYKEKKYHEKKSTKKQKDKAAAVARERKRRKLDNEVRF